MRLRREPLMICGVTRSSGIERMIASIGRNASSSTALFNSLGMLHHLQQPAVAGPCFLSCCIWVRKSSSVNSTFEQLARRLFGLLLLERLLGLLDEREHVAHPEDPPGDAVGVELLEGVELSPPSRRTRSACR